MGLGLGLAQHHQTTITTSSEQQIRLPFSIHYSQIHPEFPPTTRIGVLHPFNVSDSPTSNSLIMS
jgi:hypothetical protein